MDSLFRAFFIFICTFCLVRQANAGNFVYPFASTSAYTAYWVLEESYPGHQGVDYACSEGTPVYASVSGTVTTAYDDEVTKSCSGYGNNIIIQSGNYTVRYAHLLADTIPFEVNDTVQAGQKVGETSNTGYATNTSMQCLPNVGYHLHYEVRNNNTPVDPYSYNGGLFRIDDDGSYRFPSEVANCSEHAETINDVKESYGSFIGNATNSSHFYDSGEDYPASSEDVCIQDYDSSGTTAQRSGILYDVQGGANEAYLVRSGFWSHYSGICGGPTGHCTQGDAETCGAPLNDEYSQGGSTARQDFQTCYLYWDGSAVTSHAYPNGAGPGWFDGGYWNGAISYAFAKAYTEKGARNKMGEPVAQYGNPAGVHRWENNSSLPWVQDFDGDASNGYGWNIIMYNEDLKQAYVIRTAFWEEYKELGGPAIVGAPLGDEDNAVQEFENGTMTWNGYVVAYSTRTVQSTPVTQIPQDGDLFTGDNTFTVYVLDSGYKRGIPNEETLEDCGFNWNEVAEYSQATVDAIPEGELWTLADCLPDWSLFKGPDSATVYILENGYKRGIYGEEAFTSCGFDWGEITTFQQASVDAIPEGDLWTTGNCLFKGTDSASVYIMDNGQKHGIPNEETLEDCGYQWEDITEYSQEYVDSIPEGELWTLGDCVPDNTLIHGDASASIYVMDNGEKRGIPNEETFVVCGYSWSGFATYQQAAVDAIPEGNLWTLADCLNFSYSSVDLSGQAAVAYSDLATQPFSYTDPATGNLYTVFNGQDRIIYELAFNGSTWSSTWLSYMTWVPYAQAGTSPMGFVDPNTGYRYVVFTGSDGNIWLFTKSVGSWTSLLTFVEGSWTSTNLSNSVPVWIPYADLGSEPYGYIDPVTGYIHVVFLGTDRIVYEFTGYGSSWSTTALSYQVWVPYAQAGTSPMGFVDLNTGYRYVVFTAETGDIWMFTWNWSYWSSINLSAQDWVNYADLSSSPYGYVDSSTGYVYVVFNGIDQLIYELAFNGSYWDATVISVQDSAPYSEPGTGPTAYLDQLTGERIVLFMGDNHRVQQFVNNGSSWISTDLSSQASVPYGASGTGVSGCYDDINGTRYAVFNGDTARISMLRYGP